MVRHELYTNPENATTYPEQSWSEGRLFVHPHSFQLPTIYHLPCYPLDFYERRQRA